MEHVAIMNKKWKLIPKILSGEKYIESRWSKNKIAPWGKVNIGDWIYFKDAGGDISVRVRVSHVEQYENLDEGKIRWILENRPGIAVSNIEESVRWAKGKKYCVLVYLESPETIQPFGINKKGFGSGVAWICVETIEQIKNRSCVPKHEI